MRPFFPKFDICNVSIFLMALAACDDVWLHIHAALDHDATAIMNLMETCPRLWYQFRRIVKKLRISPTETRRPYRFGNLEKLCSKSSPRLSNENLDERAIDKTIIHQKRIAIYDTTCFRNVYLIPRSLTSLYVSTRNNWNGLFEVIAQLPKLELLGVYNDSTFAMFAAFSVLLPPTLTKFNTNLRVTLHYLPRTLQRLNASCAMLTRERASLITDPHPWEDLPASLTEINIHDISTDFDFSHVEHLYITKLHDDFDTDPFNAQVPPNIVRYKSCSRIVFGLSVERAHAFTHIATRSWMVTPEKIFVKLDNPDMLKEILTKFGPRGSIITSYIDANSVYVLQETYQDIRGTPIDWRVSYTSMDPVMHPNTRAITWCAMTQTRNVQWPQFLRELHFGCISFHDFPAAMNSLRVMTINAESIGANAFHRAPNLRQLYVNYKNSRCNTIRLNNPDLELLSLSGIVVRHLPRGLKEFSYEGNWHDISHLKIPSNVCVSLSIDTISAHILLSLRHVARLNCWYRAATPDDYAAIEHLLPPGERECRTIAF